MIGNLEPEERVMNSPSLLEDLALTIEKLQWEASDNIVVEIGGTSIYEIEGAGTNVDRNPTVSSQPNPDLKQHHAN